MRLCQLMVGVLLLASVPATPQTPADGKRVKATKLLVDQIRKDCGITTDQISYDDDKIYLKYDGMIEREKVACAQDRTILLGVGFDSYDETAPYSGPRRFIIKGPTKRLQTVAAEVVAAHWTIKHRADAGDGIAFLEIETGANFTRREVSAFLDRFIMSDLRDVAVGLAPFNLAGSDIPATAVEFRSTARRMYDRLGTRSCGTPPGFDREAMLKPDHDAVAAMERNLATSPASVHLAIAREDAGFELSKKPDSCWADDDIRFAKRHVEMVHDSVTFGTERLNLLAPAVDPLPAAAAPANAAEFRYEVRKLWTLPLCSWTTKGSNEEILAAGLAQMGQFEVRLRETPYALHYVVAKQDATYDQSQVMPECDDPGSDPVAKLSDEMLAGVKKSLEQIEKLILP